jgi:hypothetical protein
VGNRAGGYEGRETERLVEVRLGWEEKGLCYVEEIGSKGMESNGRRAERGRK